MLRLIAALLIAAASTARAEDVPGRFDYYVMSLSWSPDWCALQGDARGSPQCEAGRGNGWLLHGLWPQYAHGYPQDCRSRFAAPGRAETAAMADIMGTPGLAWHEWQAHGSCSGLTPHDYYALARQAYATVVRPPVFRKLTGEVVLPAHVVEEAFLRDNPGMTGNMITITCQSGYIQEARICLTRDLQLRACGADVARDCTLDGARFAPVR
ncbi:MAG: ribonuclease T [Limimaricola sp.]|uniref:ribonuclease T2 n=1 Tax=Limimaricola sp. TaxID=2211665 RepID=UPI001E15D7A5|nr:ribonuclease T2 [Limimaricola sp.]MBI1417453.1 ribonuclease T [Limimaricola sp.]